jgi:hypothetical protein
VKFFTFERIVNVFSSSVFIFLIDLTIFGVVKLPPINFFDNTIIALENGKIKGVGENFFLKIEDFFTPTH